MTPGLTDEEVFGPSAAPAAKPDIASMIRAEARAQGVDPAHALGIWHAEGAGDMTATSPKGARGPMQLMPGTAKDMGVDPEDLAQNIRGGVTYLKRQLATFKDPKLAFAAYNVGPGAVMAHGGIPDYPETQGYVQRAMAGAAAPTGLSDDEVFGPAPATVPPETAPGSAPEAKPPAAAAPTIAMVGGKVVFADTGRPVPEHQVKAIRTLMQGGVVDGQGEPGSLNSPLVQREAGQKFKPGQFYIDATSGQLAQVPGVDNGDGGFGSGLGAGLGDIPGSIFDLIPGHGDSEIANAMDAQRQVYGATHQGDHAAQAGRFTGQVLGSLPLMAGGEALLGKLATKAPEAMQPVLQFLGGKGGTGWIGKAVSRAARGAQEGAGAALLTSGASDEPLPEQLAAGAAMGGGLRMGAPYVARAAGRVLQKPLQAAAEAAPAWMAPLLDSLRTGGATESALSPEQLTAARYAASKNTKGLTPDQLRQINVPQITAAEAFGDAGEKALGTLVRRPGDSGQLVGDLIHARSTARGDNILQAVSDVAGIHPEDTRGALDRMVETGQSEVDPLYAKAFDDRPMWTPQLETIAARPSVKGVLKDAHRLMREEDLDPETLGMSFVENPEQWASYTPPALEAETAPVGFAGGVRGPAKPPSRGPSLLKFLADNGGVSDQGGEISAIGGDKWHVGKPFQRPLTGVLNPEDAAQQAFERGYFPQRSEAPSANELYDAMGQEMRGKALYARDADPAGLQRYQAAQAAEERAYRGGDPMDVPHPEDYVGRPAPVSEPAHQLVPKTQTWDYIKRALDDELKPYLSGAKEWTNDARLMNQTRAQLVEELKGRNSQYKTAVEAAENYLGPKEAFAWGKRAILDSRSELADVRGRMKDMTPKQMRYVRAGVANRIFNEVQDAPEGDSNRVLNAFRTPKVRAKLEAFFGPRRAAALIETVSQQGRMKAFERTWAPKANSVTSTVAAETAEQDGGPGWAAPASAVARHFMSGGGPVKGLYRLGGHLIAGGLDRVATAGMPQTVRNEAGQMLAGSPADMATLLEALKSAPSPLVGRAKFVGGMIGAGARTATEQRAGQGR